MSDSKITTHAFYEGMYIGEYEGNLLIDLDEAKRVIEMSLDAFCEECDVTDFSWDIVQLDLSDKSNGVYVSHRLGDPFYDLESLRYDVHFREETLDAAYAAYGSWKETLVGTYRGFVITRTETGYLADSEGLMSRFKRDDILELRRAIDSEHDSQSRAWASDYGGESREGFTDSENFIRDVMAGKY